MNIHNSYIPFVVLLIFSSCSKEKLTDPEFDIKTTSLTYKINEPIMFSISGNPDNITFYSGEEGKKYAFKSRTHFSGIPQLRFTSYVQFGTGGLTLLASTDFEEKRDGTASIEDIQAATWTEITNPIFSTGTDNTASGVVELSSLASLNKPVTFAFKYLNEQSSVRQRTWTIKNFNISGVSNDGTKASILAALDKANWFAVDIANASNNWAISASQLQMTGASAANAPANEDWVISRSVDLTVVNRDVGVAIKTLATSVSEYTYSYAQAGTYKVVFEATNVLEGKDRSTVKEIDLVITE